MRTALVIILLLAILAGAVFVGHYGWVSAGDIAMPAWGWLMTPAAWRTHIVLHRHHELPDHPYWITPFRGEVGVSPGRLNLCAAR